MVILCFYLFLAFSPKLKVSVILKLQALLFCNLRELKWGTVSVTITKAEYYNFTVRKRWKLTCLFQWNSWSVMVHFSLKITLNQWPSVCLGGQTWSLILKLLPSSLRPSKAPILALRRRCTSVVFSWHEPKWTESGVFTAQPGWRSWKPVLLCLAPQWANIWPRSTLNANGWWGLVD